MNRWLHKSASFKYKIEMNGRLMSLSEDAIGKLIKQKLCKSRVIHHFFEQFEVSLDYLENLKISIGPLDEKFAETDAQEMKLNESLFEDGKFFQEHLFIVFHEIIHFLSRVKEEMAYLNDPEEVLGFVSSIGHELEQGSDFDTIWNRIYPKISFHFHNEEDAKGCFSEMYEKAMEIF